MKRWQTHAVSLFPADVLQGELPFASCASISYSLCLIFGYLIKLSTNGVSNLFVHSLLSAHVHAVPLLRVPALLPQIRMEGPGHLCGELPLCPLHCHWGIQAICRAGHVGVPLFLMTVQGRPLLLENADTSPQEFNSGFVALATGTHTVGESTAFGLRVEC